MRALRLLAPALILLAPATRAQTPPAVPDSPLSLLRFEVCASFAQARQRETQLIRWLRAKKEAPIYGDTDSLRKLSRWRD